LLVSDSESGLPVQSPFKSRLDRGPCHGPGGLTDSDLAGLCGKEA
jgi:hypothetical protein